MGKIAKTANTFILAVSILLIIMVLNFLVARHIVWRIDLTKDKLYTLTDSSKKIVGGLNDHVNIKAYFSQKLPPYLSNIRQDVEDILKEYQAHAKGNLHVKFIDPSNFDEEQKRKLMYDGVMPINLQTIEKHKFEIMEAYFGMTIHYEDRKETIPVVDPSSLEYDLSAAIKKVSLPKTPVLGVFTNKEDLDLERDYSLMYRSLRKLYEIRPAMITEGQKIPENIDILLLIAPRDFSESELFEIDQYVMRGGKMICLVDAIDLDERTLNANPMKPNITKLLANYGVIVNDDLVEDMRSNALATFSSGFMRTMINYPYWVSSQENLNRESAITKRLNALVLPWVSSISVSENKPEGVEITRLASTTKFAFQNKAPFNLNPFQRERPDLKREDLAQYDLVLLAEGRFPSAYKGEAIPESKQADDEAPAQRFGTREDERKEQSDKTTILVTPNSLFLRDQYLQSARAEDNLTFIENTIDSMALGQDLIGIRTRSMAQRPLKPELTDAQKTTYKWLTILGAPVLALLFSLIRIPWVRSRRRYYETILVKD